MYRGVIYLLLSVTAWLAFSYIVENLIPYLFPLPQIRSLLVAAMVFVTLFLSTLVTGKRKVIASVISLPAGYVIAWILMQITLIRYGDFLPTSLIIISAYWIWVIILTPLYYFALVKTLDIKKHESVSSQAPKRGIDDSDESIVMTATEELPKGHIETEVVTKGVIGRPSSISITMSAPDKPTSEEKVLELLIEHLEKNDIWELVPLPDRTSPLGGRYPVLEESLKIDQSETLTILQMLEEKLIILPKSVEFRTIACPNCDSSLYNVFILCSECGSQNLVKIQSVLHKTCRFIGPINLYKKPKGFLCPNCGADLTQDLTKRTSDDVEFIEFFRCISCGAVLEEPKVGFRCLTCGTDYGVKELKIKEHWRYEFDRNRIEGRIRKTKIIISLMEKFQENGIRFIKNAKLTGRSGIIYELDLLVMTDETNPTGIIVIISNLGESGLQDLFKLLVISVDVELKKLIILVIGTLKPDVKRILEQRNIIIFEECERPGAENEIFDMLIGRKS